MHLKKTQTHFGYSSSSRPVTTAAETSLGDVAEQRQSWLLLQPHTNSASYRRHIDTLYNSGIYKGLQPFTITVTPPAKCQTPSQPVTTCLKDHRPSHRSSWSTWSLKYIKDAIPPSQDPHQYTQRTSRSTINQNTKQNLAKPPDPQVRAAPGHTNRLERRLERDQLIKTSDRWRQSLNEAGGAKTNLERSSKQEPTATCPGSLHRWYLSVVG